jgi:amino acid transporter
MANVAKDLPRVIHFSLGIVVFMFLLANVSYFVVLPKELVAHSNTVALVSLLSEHSR